MLHVRPCAEGFITVMCSAQGDIKKDLGLANAALVATLAGVALYQGTRKSPVEPPKLGSSTKVVARK